MIFQVDVSSKKQTKNEFYFTTMKPQVDLFLFGFFEEIEDTKKTFRNYLTFSVHKNQLNRPNDIHTVQELIVTSILFPGTK